MKDRYYLSRSLRIGPRALFEKGELGMTPIILDQPFYS